MYSHFNQRGDTITDFTVGVGGDILGFDDNGFLDLHPENSQGTLTYYEGASSGNVGGANVIVITDVQAGLTSAAAVDTFRASLTGNSAGGAILIFQTTEGGDAQVWYDYRSTDIGGAGTGQLATLTGVTDLGAFDVSNFIVF